MHVVRKEKDRFIHVGNDVYLPRLSPQSQSNHLNWRMKSVERSLNDDEVHYTTVFSVAKSDIDKLKHQIVQLIEAQRKFVKGSGTDVACVFCCDFFTY